MDQKIYDLIDGYRDEFVKTLRNGSGFLRSGMNPRTELPSAGKSAG